MDAWEWSKRQGAQVQEIGLGSGVLSIGALKEGAKQVTALAINPGAKIFAGFNVLLNGTSAGLCVLDGHVDDNWASVQGRRFDDIISNSPFMPSPPDSSHFFHSGGGAIFGMDFLANIFRSLDEHLDPAGQAQFVTAALGDDTLPTALLALANEHLSGSPRIMIDPLAMSFEVLTHHLPERLPSKK